MVLQIPMNPWVPRRSFKVWMRLDSHGAARRMGGGGRSSGGMMGSWDHQRRRADSRVHDGLLLMILRLLRYNRVVVAIVALWRGVVVSRNADRDIRRGSWTTRGSGAERPHRQCGGGGCVGCRLHVFRVCEPDFLLEQSRHCGV